MNEKRERDVATWFANDVSNHEMTVKMDHGVYRHLRFQKPGTWNHGFDIVTWPEFLAFTGDMGEFLFSRTTDMLEFFRGGDRPSFGYWAEKVQAADARTGIEEYSQEKFIQNVWRSARQWFDIEEGTPIPPDLKKAIERDVLDMASDGEHLATAAAMNFSWEGEYPFQDYWETNNKEYSHRFLWCCYAIRWAIERYDRHKDNEVKVDTGIDLEMDDQT